MTHAACRASFFPISCVMNRVVSIVYPICTPPSLFSVFCVTQGCFPTTYILQASEASVLTTSAMTDVSKNLSSFAISIVTNPVLSGVYPICTPPTPKTGTRDNPSSHPCACVCKRGHEFSYRAGVKFAFGTFSNEFSRNLPYQAATAVAFGLPYDEALKAVTVNPAQIWGVGDKVGSIEEGKWADLMITDGDPLETKTR